MTVANLPIIICYCYCENFVLLVACFIFFALVVWKDSKLFLRDKIVKLHALTLYNVI
jgi:hypothetical protein